MADLLAPRQLEFILNSTAKNNIAYGPVRSGKTVGSLSAFMHEVTLCPDSQIWMIGHTASTIYDNAVRLLLESNTPNNPLGIYLPFITWHPAKRVLKFKDKTISTLGAKDEGAIGTIQGKTFSLCYCDEITLYPESIIDMIDTRLSNPHSKLIATCNPSYPDHKIKKWIDKAEQGDKNYYALQFTIDDNPYLTEDYKLRLRNSLSGLFYKRNYLGLWCLAEGAIFDFFDRDVHVVKKPPRAAEYWIAAVDYGMVHPCVCLLIGVNSGQSIQGGKCMWVEKEYFWDVRQKGRQKLVSELADDIAEFLEPYSVRSIYIDPAAEVLHAEFRRRKMHVVHAKNDVYNGIMKMISEMNKGNLFICEECVNTIRQIQSYVWDSKAALRGEDEPLKKEDDCCDALRYAILSHEVSTYNPYAHNPNKYIRDRFNRNF